jgi:hypothetical protein
MKKKKEKTDYHKKEKSIGIRGAKFLILLFRLFRGIAPGYTKERMKNDCISHSGTTNYPYPAACI